MNEKATEQFDLQTYRNIKYMHESDFDKYQS